MPRHAKKLNCLPCDFSENVAGVWASSHENVSAIVHKLGHALHGQAASELLNGWREQDEVVVQERSVFFEDDGGVVGYFEGDLQSHVLQVLEKDGVGLFYWEVIQEGQNAVAAGRRCHGGEHQDEADSDKFHSVLKKQLLMYLNNLTPIRSVWSS